MINSSPISQHIIWVFVWAKFQKLELWFPHLTPPSEVQRQFDGVVGSGHFWHCSRATSVSRRRSALYTFDFSLA